ncbi:unnamed protein product [Mytilus coruscus]|uniref:Reverse transcriptase domain-containing protein n=1 Tax=Mytilus coruscus TaxID=42192 RepID=A0A6J8B260_MYTCO|nr:unnamed protein product [Mytilus coruscus]
MKTIFQKKIKKTLKLSEAISNQKQQPKRKLEIYTDPEDTKSDKTENNITKAKIPVDYFSSVFTKEPYGQVPLSNKVPVTNKMSKQEIKEEVVLKHLSALKIDSTLEYLKRYLSQKQNLNALSLISHLRVPTDWKNAFISAIFKKGNKSLAKNYRPVSLTSVVCKIMEKILQKFIIEHMKTNNLFSKKTIQLHCREINWSSVIRSD